MRTYLLSGRLLGLSTFMLAAIICTSASFLLAQNETPPQAPPAQAQVHVVDGGAREVLVSIFIPPLAHAPFSLVLDTEWARPLGSNGSVTTVNRRHIMRDSAGRIYQERWILVPKGGKIESQMNYIEVADPVQHTIYDCQVQRKTCELRRYLGSTGTAYTPGIGVSGPLPNGNGFRTREELGTNNINGVETIGSRETVTINPGVLGNDQPLVSTREFWYSPQLGINLLSRLDDPRSGKQTFTVTELSTSEPEPKFLEMPEGYKVIDERKTEPPSY